MRFIVLGGGCYGSFYTKQLIKAADSHAIGRPEILVVDHNPQPRASAELGVDERVQFVCREWDGFFDEWLETLPSDADDQVVPSPFTPHLAVSWLLRKLRRVAPHMNWQTEPFLTLPGTPFERHSANGTVVASHADWVCPVHCVEPATCPKTRGPRDWDMAVTAHAFARALTAAGQPVDQVHLLQCLHLTHGVGTYPAAALLSAGRAMQTAVITDTSEFRTLVGTVSRCHGAMHLITGRRGTDTVSPATTTGAVIHATISRGPTSQ